MRDAGGWRCLTSRPEGVGAFATTSGCARAFASRESFTTGVMTRMGKESFGELKR